MARFDFNTCKAMDRTIVDRMFATRNSDRSKFAKHINLLYKLWEMTGCQPVEVEPRSTQHHDLPNVGSAGEVCGRRWLGKHALAKASSNGFDCYYDGHRYEIKFTTCKTYRSTGLTDSEMKTSHGVLVFTDMGVFVVTMQQLKSLNLLRSVGTNPTPINRNIVAWSAKDYIEAGLTPIAY